MQVPAQRRGDRNVKGDEDASPLSAKLLIPHGRTEEFFDQSGAGLSEGLVNLPGEPVACNDHVEIGLDPSLVTGTI